MLEYLAGAAKGRYCRAALRYFDPVRPGACCKNGDRTSRITGPVPVFCNRLEPCRLLHLPCSAARLRARTVGLRVRDVAVQTEGADAIGEYVAGSVARPIRPTLLNLTARAFHRPLRVLYAGLTE